MTTEINEEYYRDYNVDVINAATEEEAVGELGRAMSLLPGLAENLIKDIQEPDVVLKRIVNTEGEWNVDSSVSVSILYPGNSTQATVGRITQSRPSGDVVSDYYQIPYCEVVPRISAIVRSRLGTDERWFAAQINNIQLECWLDETGVLRLSDQALELLEDREHEIIRNKHRSIMEQTKKRTDD